MQAGLVRRTVIFRISAASELDIPCTSRGITAAGRLGSSMEMHSFSLAPSSALAAPRSGDALAKADSHLEKCGPCRAFLDTLKATVTLLKSSPEEKAPPTLRPEILESLKRQHD